MESYHELGEAQGNACKSPGLLNGVGDWAEEGGQGL